MTAKLNALADSSGSREADVDEDVLDQCYDRFVVTLTDAAVFLKRGGPQWRAQLNTSSPPAYLLRPLSMTVTLSVSVAAHLPFLPALRVAGELPKMSIAVSNGKVGHQGGSGRTGHDGVILR